MKLAFNDCISCFWKNFALRFVVFPVVLPQGLPALKDLGAVFALKLALIHHQPTPLRNTLRISDPDLDRLRQEDLVGLPKVPSDELLVVQDRSLALGTFENLVLHYKVEGIDGGSHVLVILVDVIAHHLPRRPFVVAIFTLEPALIDDEVPDFVPLLHRNLFILLCWSIGILFFRSIEDRVFEGLWPLQGLCNISVLLFIQPVAFQDVLR